MGSPIDIETKDYIIDCVLSGKHNAEIPHVDVMVDLNHMCREVYRWHIKSILKEVDKMTELTKQLQANIDNAPILKEGDSIYRKKLKH